MIIKYSIKAVDIAMTRNFLVLICILMQIKLAYSFPLPAYAITIKIMVINFPMA